MSFGWRFVSPLRFSRVLARSHRPFGASRLLLFVIRGLSPTATCLRPFGAKSIAPEGLSESCRVCTLRVLFQYSPSINQRMDQRELSHAAAGNV